MKRFLVINTKAKKNGVARRVETIAKAARKYSKKGVEIILAVQTSDIMRISKIVTTYAQHVDPIPYGSYTGWILPEAVKQAGAKGTLINHSEHKLDMKDIKKTIIRAREVGLKTLVCTSSIDEGRKIARLNPDFLAFEDPQLIGTKKSVSETEPETVKRFADMVKRINPKIISLCGAGIADANDVEAAIRLGTHGVLLSTAVVSAKNPSLAIKNLIGGMDV